MSEKNNYIIDKNILNDIECNCHELKRRYIKYCLTCDKNLCNWCEGHDKHELKDFNSLDPGPEAYRLYEEKLSKMEAINKSFFEKTLLDFQKRKDNIKKMLDDINDVISDINISANIFEKQLNFNKTIINAYKESKINYYILDNFKNLDFVLNTKNYEKKWNINNFRLKEQNKEKFQLNTKKLPRFILPNLILNLNNKSGQDSKKTEFEGFTNMWISEKYCKSWGLREAIREFLQNQHDGIISKLKTKNDLQVIKIGKKENINNMKVYVNFDFINKANNKIYGHIRYDNIKNILTISNKGFLWLGDFILGCSKDEENNPDLIGTFGEGMKLAILAYAD